MQVSTFFSEALKEAEFEGPPGYDQSQGSHVTIEAIVGDAENIKQAIKRFLRTKGPKAPTNVEPTVKPQVIASVIRQDLECRGKFLVDDNDACYYFFEPEKRVYEIKTLKFDLEYRPFLQDEFGLNTTLPVGKFAFEHIRNYALRHGERVAVPELFFYDTNKQFLAVYDRTKHYYLLDGQTIERVPNGEGGFYFRDYQRTAPIQYLPPEERIVPTELLGVVVTDNEAENASFLEKVMVCRTNLTATPALSREEQRKLLFLHIHAYAFADLVRTKPISMFVGNRGSSKTWTQTQIGMLLFDAQFAVKSMPTKEEDAMVTAATNDFLFYQNVDRKYRWFEDFLAVVATGADFTKRKLYSDFKPITGRLNCFLSLDSREPFFRREDVTQRSLIFHLEPLSQKVGEITLLQTFVDYRNLLWSEYLDNLNKIVGLLRQKDLRKILTTHRLADWAVFITVASEALDILNEEELTNLLGLLEIEQAAFTLENDPLLSALKFLLRQDKDGVDWITAGVLLEKFEQLSELKGFPKRVLNEYGSPQALGTRLSKVASELAMLIGLERREKPHKHTHEYRLGHKKGKASLDDFF